MTRPLLAVLLLVAGACTSASTRTPTGPAPANGPAGAGTAQRPAGAPGAAPTSPGPQGGPARGPRPYREIITAQAKTDTGLFNVHQVGDRWFYEIPDSLLNREMLLVTRIAQTARNIGFGGESSQESVLRWQRVGNRVLMRYAVYENRAADSLPIAQAVRASNFEPILQAFDIATIRPDSQAIVIEVGPLFTRDVPLLGLAAPARQQFQVRRLDDTRSMVNSMRSFPINVEVRNILTYDAGQAPSSNATASISLEMSHSMVLLPKVPMRPRIADQRIGYFQVDYTDFGNTGQRVEPRAYINRWRLEPKDTAAFRRGELTEPVKQIVYYIDPATPLKWRPYLKEGVNAWARVFEQAGFRNAIVAKDPPTAAEDPDWSPEDARYSVIRYFASTVENAYGPQVIDPRSGEVIEADIGWFHNATNIFAQLYRLQVGAVDARALQRELPDEIMGSLIRYVAAHEVGHTLGLRHSHGVSAGIPVDSLRSPTYMARLGSTTPSIMDYARWNYVAQPGDGVTTLGPWFGPYDDYAIRWGYRPILEATTAEGEKATLDRWILDRAGDPMYRYASDEEAFSGIDPTSVNEQLGDDPTKASRYGIANLKRVAPRMHEFTRAPGADFSRLANTQANLQLQWNWLIGPVVATVGGRVSARRTADQPGPAWTAVPRERQVAAMRFLNDEVWTAPTWIANPDQLDLIEHAGAVERVRGLQRTWLNNLLDHGRMQRLIEAEARYGREAYTLPEMLRDLRRDIWRELSGTAPISLHRRNLQRGYLERMQFLMTTDQAPLPAAAAAFTIRTNVNVPQSDIRPLIRSELETVRAEADRAAARTTDAMTRAHLRDVSARIRDLLEPSR